MRQLDIHVVRFDGSPEDAIHGLESEFGLNHEAAVRFVQSVPRLARSGTAPQEARAYQQVLSAMGAVVELRPTHSLPTPADTSVPSLPRPPVMKSPHDAGYHSSAALAQRVPRAPAVPLEAWNRPPRGGYDELGNPLPQDPPESELTLSSWHDRSASPSSPEVTENVEEHQMNLAWASLPEVASAIAANSQREAEQVVGRGSQRGLWFGVALLLIGIMGGLYVRWQTTAKPAVEAVETH